MYLCFSICSEGYLKSNILALHEHQPMMQFLFFISIKQTMHSCIRPGTIWMYSL